jgi:hypothetical protein
LRRDPRLICPSDRRYFGILLSGPLPARPLETPPQRQQIRPSSVKGGGGTALCDRWRVNLGPNDAKSQNRPNPAQLAPDSGVILSLSERKEDNGTQRRHGRHNMAATMTPRSLARILHLQGNCEAVSQTDRQKRLPTISSAEVETIFDQMSRQTLRTSRAA